MNLTIKDGALNVDLLRGDIGPLTPVARVKLEDGNKRLLGSLHEAHHDADVVAMESELQKPRMSIRIEWKQSSAQNHIDERVTITNKGVAPVALDQLDVGLEIAMPSADWFLKAIPFTVQANGLEYDLSMAMLQDGKVKSPGYQTDCPYWPETCDAGELRSEAWLLHGADRGLLVIKYNPRDIEFSMVRPHDRTLCIGGAGFSLYHEPAAAMRLGPGKGYTFGLTRYVPIRAKNPVLAACQAFYSFLESAGHGIPADYDPPVNWNELYDVGWWHSDQAKLKAHYTRDALLAEADKAAACHAEALYLDPGWEVHEGTTTWDEARLGPPGALVKDVAARGIKLAFRTILRDYKGWIPEPWLVEHKEEDLKPGTSLTSAIPKFREGCFTDPGFRKEKLKRVLGPILAGVAFLMVDEHDWRGPCHEPAHGHGNPSTAADHATAVLDYCKAIRSAVRETTGHDLLIEAHDPVWPWANRYCPVYFRQGFSTNAAYQENWGFEFMWNPIADLRLGKAFSLYHYAAACPIPLYLHINMSHDNEYCLFFWWAASTVRHLGIGGKTCNASICQTGMAHDVDPAAQYRRYQDAMAEYRAHKPWFVRGRFIGINEDVHLHVLDGLPGGILLVYNLDFEERIFNFEIEWAWIHSEADRSLQREVKDSLACEIDASEGSVRLSVRIAPGHVARVYLGKAVLG